MYLSFYFWKTELLSPDRTEKSLSQHGEHKKLKEPRSELLNKSSSIPRTWLTHCPDGGGSKHL
jgi:hypothetical protein